MGDEWWWKALKDGVTNPSADHFLSWCSLAAKQPVRESWNILEHHIKVCIQDILTLSKHVVCHTCHILPYPAIPGMPSLCLPLSSYLRILRFMQVPWMSMTATAPMAPVCRPAAWLVAWRPPWSQWSITCWSGSTAHQDAVRSAQVDVQNEFKMIEMVHYGPKSHFRWSDMIYIYIYIYVLMLYGYIIYVTVHDICDSWHVILWILWLPEDGIGSVCI